jgi:tetratricopeptide (TPR) repeat protein
MAKHRAPLSTRQLSARLSQGLAHHRAGRLAEAIACFRGVVALQPNCFEVHFNLAAVLFASGQLAESAESYRRAALLRPRDADVHYSLGVVLQSMGDTVPAAEAYEKALQIRPEYAKALGNLGYLRLCMRDLPAAERLLRRCIALDPGNVNAHCNLGTLFAQQGDTVAVVESCRSALALDPDHARTLSLLGAAFMEVGEIQKAEAIFRRSIALDPDKVAAHCGLADALTKQGNVAGAVEETRKALAIDPTHALTLCNFGVLLDSLGDGTGALQCYQLALAAHPECKLAQYNLGIRHLGFGDFAQGWPEYEARWDTSEFRAINTRPALAQPQWRGEDIRGSRILLHSEQGLGDTLQFVRYVSMVAALGATVVLRVQPSLVRLLSTLDKSIAVESIESDAGGDFEWQCSLMSLPLAFRTGLTTIPGNVPYLRADPAAAAEWSRRLPARGLRIGLVWAGNPKNTRDRLRSIALRQLAGVACLQGATFYSLQKGPAAQELAATPEAARIVDLSQHLDDFTDTAAIVANLDLVISVDTSVAHLAGAMGKPVWILVAHANDWRWLKDRSDSPWYPTVRIFRQSAVGRWDDVLEQVEQELGAMSNAHHSSPALVMPAIRATAVEAYPCHRQLA